MNILRLKSNLTNFLFIIAIFSAYSLFNISNFYIQVVLMCMVILYFLSVFSIYYSNIVINKNICIISSVFLIYLLLNYLLMTRATTTSLLLMIFFFGLMLLTYRYIREDQFDKIINVFVIIMTILAIYGIYQFFARQYELPLSDLRINDHMVAGFNWSNQIYINSKFYYRSNSICFEPSIFSQYLAINIGFLLVKLNKNKSFKFIFILIINFFALILTFSGTGLILLITILIWYIYKSYSAKNIFKLIKYAILFSIAIIIISKMFNNQIVIYLLNRINEFNQTDTSGSLRFRQSYIDMINLISQNPILGFGIGSTSLIAKSAIRNSTIARITSEIGILGLVLWITFLFLLFNKNNAKNGYYTIIFIFIIISNILGENFASAYYWAFIYLVNFRIIFNNSYDNDISN